METTRDFHYMRSENLHIFPITPDEDDINDYDLDCYYDKDEYQCCMHCRRARIEELWATKMWDSQPAA